MQRIIRNCFRWATRKLNIVAYLTAENLALRQQLIVLKRTQNRPKLKERDRLFWVIVSRAWSGWRDALLIVQPDTLRLKQYTVVHRRKRTYSTRTSW